MPTNQEDLANGHTNLHCHSSFFLCFGPQFLGACASLRSVVGHVDDEFCNDDLEDEFVPPWNDRMYEMVSFAIKISTHFV